MSARDSRPRLIDSRPRRLETHQAAAADRRWLIAIAGERRCRVCHRWVLGGERAVYQPRSELVVCLRCADAQRLVYAPARRGTVLGPALALGPPPG